MRLFPRRDFLMASAVCASIAGAPAADAAQGGPPSQSSAQKAQAVISSPPPKIKLSLDIAPPRERYGQGPRLEELENSYEDKRPANRVELSEGVYGKFKPLSFRLTVLLP